MGKKYADSLNSTLVEDIIDDLLIINGVNYFGKAQYQF